MTPKVVLLLRIRTRDGKRTYVQPVASGNQHLRALWGIVNNTPEHHPEGTYYLRYTVANGRRAWEPVGQNPNEAIAGQLRRERILAAQAVGVKVEDPRNRVRLADAVAAFLRRAGLRSANVQKICGYILPHFATVGGKTYLDEVRGEDLLAYMRELRKAGNEPRTVYNKVKWVSTFLKAQGITGLLAPHERPKYVEKVVDSYNEDELKRLFTAATPEERMLFEFFVFCGGRRREVQFATWQDLNFTNKVFAVHSKPQFNFEPKDHEERTIPLPDPVIEALQARHQARNGNPLIFPTKKGKPDGHLLRFLKAAALRAGLNCGECISKTGLSCQTHPVCKRVTLHKFRRSFATIHHRNGVDARTIQHWLGHNSLETTLRYLHPADACSAKTRAQVNNSFAVFRS